MGTDIIDLAEWRKKLNLDTYKREEANLIVLAHILKTNLYLIGEASGVKRNAEIKKELLREINMAHEMAKEINAGAFN